MDVGDSKKEEATKQSRERTYLNSISLTDDVVGDGSAHTQAVEDPVAGIKGISGRCHSTGSATTCVEG